MIIIALVVAIVWSIISLTSILIRDYAALSIVTPIMAIVAGFLFAYKKNGNGK